MLQCDIIYFRIRGPANLAKHILDSNIALHIALYFNINLQALLREVFPPA